MSWEYPGLTPISLVHFQFVIVEVKQDVAFDLETQLILVAQYPKDNRQSQCMQILKVNKEHCPFQNLEHFVYIVQFRDKNIGLYGDICEYVANLFNHLVRNAYIIPQNS